jgi:PAS domain S-box-containing protein
MSFNEVEQQPFKALIVDDEESRLVKRDSMSAKVRIMSSELPSLGLAPLEILQKVFDQHAIISVADANGDITYVNDKFCEVSGYERDELIGKNHRAIKSGAHSAEFYEELWDTISHGRTWQGQIQNRRKDGSPYWVQTTIMPVFDDEGIPEQYISIRTDISQQVLSSRDLSRFKKILDNTLDSVFMFDAENLLFTYVNQGAVEQVGFTEPELLSMSPLDIKPEMNEEEFRAMMDPLLKEKEGSLTFETVHEHKSGRQIPVEIFLQYFPQHDGAGQFIAIVRDASERKRTVTALEALSVADPADNVFFSIAKAVADALDVRWVGVGKRVDDELQVVGFWDSGHKGELFSRTLDGTPCDDVCIQRQPLTLTDQVTARYPNDDLLQNIGAVSFRGEPLISTEGYDLGVLFAVDDKPCKEAATERALMRVAAKRASLELQRLSAEQAAQKQSRQLYETLERISDGFFSLDDQWRFTYLNPSAAKIFNTTWYDLKGKCIWSVMPEMTEHFQPHLRQAMREQERVLVEEFKPLDRWLALYVYPSPQGVSVYIQDVTEYKRLRDEYRHMEKQIQKSQKMDAIGQLTAGIAHDFNNILASINGYTDLALNRCVGEGQEKLKEYLEQVYSAGERARDLIQQMMTYSRTSTSTLEQTVLDPRPVIAETVKMLRSTFPASIDLTSSLPDEGNMKINIESVQLQQIVMNLCINARDAMHGTGHLDLRLQLTDRRQYECSSCHATVEGSYVVLTVQDSGDGIAAEALEHLFEPFFTTKDVGEGTGLGLSVVHGIMHDHNGHIRVESVSGKGTSFSLLFPRLAEEVAEVKPVVTIQNADEKPQMKADPAVGNRIMVVDDEPSVLGFLQIWLKRNGYVTQAFGDAQEALAYFENHPDDFDLLLTDHTMPGITGKDLIDKVHALRPELPAILCSGYVGRTNIEQAAKLGVSHFVEKPFNQKKLLAVIEELLGE